MSIPEDGRRRTRLTNREDPERPQAASRPRAGETPPPASVQEALVLARQHTQAALAEALAATRALLDAASIALSGEASDTHRTLGQLARGIDAWQAALSSRAGRLPLPLSRAILDALDAEIARWEGHSREDADARAVLRAFLSMREILWEFGLRRADTSAPRAPASEAHAHASEAPEPLASEGRQRGAIKRAGRGRRVERIRVQG